MVQLTLKQDMFVNNKFAFSYGGREALFTIVDEEFAGHNRLGRINRITVLVRKLDKTGKELGARLSAPVIGIGDDAVLVKCEDLTLRSKVFNKDNMEQCVVTLFEDNDAE